ESRLSRLRTQAGAPAAADKPPLSPLRARLAQLQSRGRTTGKPVSTTTPALPVEALAKRLEGECIAEGVIRIRQRVPLAGTLGGVSLTALHDKPRLPGEPGGSRRHVYIDTETTGLSGGSGTLAFLLGVAVVEADAIDLTQWLITRFAAEAAALSAFADILTAADRLVSYNGKSYDLPLLISRFRMQGLQPDFQTLAHLDLLHPVRRLFGKRWNDCRLLSVEERLLGFRRVDDLPGSEAPAAWFRYLREGQAEALIRVVEHNRQDILSLAVAHAALSQAINQPETYDVDLHALARWLCDCDAEEQARTLLQANSTELCDDGKRLLARLLRRAGHWSQAVAVWEALAAGGCLESIERLAKYHEHISKDLGAAQRCCDRLPPTPAILHRRQRIDRKLNATRQAW
ncbi:MAG: ribonuclease H-like domain-containing protein, partial [Gammaproteobacteria bacterium]